LNLPVFEAVEVGKEYEDAPNWSIEKIEKAGSSRFFFVDSNDLAY